MCFHTCERRRKMQNLLCGCGCVYSVKVVLRKCLCTLHCMMCCAAETSLYLLLTDHSGMLHKYCLIKCVCARTHPCEWDKVILLVNQHTSRNWSYLSAARCFPTHFLWIFFFPCGAVDENREPKLLCQEDTRAKASRKNNWICFITKLWFVFMCMCQTNRRCLTQRQKEWQEKIASLTHCSPCLCLHMAEHAYFCVDESCLNFSDMNKYHCKQFFQSETRLSSFSTSSCVVAQTEFCTDWCAALLLPQGKLAWRASCLCTVIHAQIDNAFIRAYVSVA